MERLPLSGFVLAGGLSSRMGTDKALLEFCDRPMVEIAVETLRGFCEEVRIVGNRDDLARFAPVVRETRVYEGPTAGIEAGLSAASQPWAMFMPVDVPLVPAVLLSRWMSRVRSMAVDASVLVVNGARQPAFCAFRLEARAVALAAIEAGERRINGVLQAYGDALLECDAAELVETPAEGEMERWFANVNTPEDLAEAQRYARHPKERLPSGTRS